MAERHEATQFCRHNFVLSSCNFFALEIELIIEPCAAVFKISKIPITKLDNFRVNLPLTPPKAALLKLLSSAKVKFRQFKKLI